MFRNPSLYVDTRYKTPTKLSIGASESGFFDKSGTFATRSKYGEQPVGNPAPQSLVDLHTGSSGLCWPSGVQKL